MDILGVTVDVEALAALATVYFLQFVLFTCLAFAARQGDALRWDMSLLKSAGVNWLFIGTNSLLAPAVYVVINLADSWFRASGIPRISEEFWLFAPAIVPALVALVAADFMDYWSHRIRHVSVLWPMHAVHHSDTQMHYLTWYRAHVIELVVIQGGYVLLATWLGASPAAVMGVVLFRAAHQQYVHMNVDWTHGPFKWVLASPRFHRWHHADHTDAWDKNFSSIFPIWDRLFGTYYCPGACKEPLGFPGNPGEHYIKLMLFPFQEWGRMIRDRFVQRPPAELGAAETK
ncbi:MAG: sterol desaturase family protein, partial [Pseudomonadota bacterium]